MIKVYVMRYVESGKVRWFDQSMDRDTAFAMGRRFAKLGRKPFIVRIDTDAATLANCGRVACWTLKTKRVWGRL